MQYKSETSVQELIFSLKKIITFSINCKKKEQKTEKFQIIG